MNPHLQQAREAALKFLRPTPAQLEHGLEVHAHSIVCDAFGFVPRSAPDGDALRAMVAAGASEIELRDTLEEMRMIRCAQDLREREEFQAAWEASGVTGIFVCAGEESNTMACLLKRMARLSYLAGMMPDLLWWGSIPEDFAAAKSQGRRCLYPAGNGVPLPQQWISVEAELAYIRVFFQLGYRMMHLTYNRRNAIGGGCGEPEDVGVSDFGTAVVAEMNRAGMIIDVSHCGQRTSRQAAGRSAYPIVASHTTCHALNPHFRAKTDEVIRAIADGGGCVGICAVPAFLGRSRNIVALLDHIDYVARRFGVEHVAIGSDVDAVSTNHEAQMQKVPAPPPTRERWEHLWPDRSCLDSGLEQPENLLSLAWTNWPLFTVGLVQRGYRDADIQKIIGGNILRIAKQAIGADAGYLFRHGTPSDRPQALALPASNVPRDRLV